jgi:hypothetical protein
VGGFKTRDAGEEEHFRIENALVERWHDD